MGVDAVLQSGTETFTWCPRFCFEVWQRQYRPTIHIFPGRPRSNATERSRSLKGFLLFSGLWKRDKVLWLGSWSLHLGLLLVALAHTRAIIPLGASIDQICMDVALFGSGLMTVSGVYLLVRRMLVQRAREITDLRDYLAELTLLAFSATAFAMMLDGGVASDVVNTYLMGIVTGEWVDLNVPEIFVWHMFCAQLLLIVTPFSPFVTFGRYFFEPRIFGFFGYFCR